MLEEKGMAHRVRKTHRHAKRPRDRVTRSQINRVRRYFNQANNVKKPYAAIMHEIMNELRAYRDDDGTLTEQYLRASDRLQAGFERLRRANRVNQALIDKIMSHKGWTREQVNRPIPADA